MLCQRCGTDNSDYSTICSNCGNPLFFSANPSEKYSKPSKGRSFSSGGGKHTDMMTVLTILVVCLVSFLFLMFFKSSSSSKVPINLNDYLVFDLEGYDGSASLNARVDFDSLKRDYGRSINFNKNADYSGYYSPIDVLRYGVYVQLDNYGAVHNGQEIGYSWVILSDVYDQLNIQLSYTNGTYTVNGLDSDYNTFNTQSPPPVPSGSTSDNRYWGEYADGGYYLVLNNNEAVPEGIYVIVTDLDPVYSLDVRGSSQSNDADIMIWERNGSKAQRFYIHSAGTDSSNRLLYTVCNYNSGKYMSASYGSTNGLDVFQHSYSSSYLQNWYIEPAGDGTFYLILADVNKYLDVEDANAVDGNNVQVYNRNSSLRAQNWRLIILVDD